MKHQVLLSLKDRKKIKAPSAAILLRSLRVKMPMSRFFSFQNRHIWVGFCCPEKQTGCNKI